MAETGAQLVGSAALGRDLARFARRGGDLTRALREAHRRAVAPVAAVARGSVPRVSGTLAGSLGDWPDDDDPSGWQAGYDGVEYAGPVDMGGWPEGRSYVGSGRYLFPAAASIESAAANADADGAQRALDSFAWTNTTTDPRSVHD